MEYSKSAKFRTLALSNLQKCHLTLWYWKSATDNAQCVPKMPEVIPLCLKSNCTDILFECLLDSLEITSYLLQSM